MSYEINVFCSLNKIPSFDSWQSALKEKGSHLQFSEDFNLEQHEGFVPCRSQSTDTGFEYFCEPISNDIREALETEIPASWDTLISFIARDYDEIAAAVSASAVLTELTNGGLSQEGETALKKYPEVFDWAREKLDGLSIEKQTYEAQQAEIARIKSSRDPSALFTSILQGLIGTDIDQVMIMMDKFFIMAGDVRLFSNSWNLETSDTTLMVSRYKRIRDKQMAMLRKTPDIDEDHLSELESTLEDAAKDDARDLAKAAKIVASMMNPLVRSVTWHQSEGCLVFSIRAGEAHLTIRCFTGDMSSISVNKGAMNLEVRCGDITIS